jgi:zinc/manganese transport system substrate-binding protein
MNMKRLLIAGALLLGVLAAQAKLNVVATLPDFGSIAESIGGDKIKVTSIARGAEDPHFVDARPSFIRVLNQADVLIEGGADLEIGWLPPLVSGARNSKIVGTAPGHVILSRGLTLLEVPNAPVDRSQGDVHPGGNPHYWLDPANAKPMAARLAEVFSQLDAANASHYAANLKQFNAALDDKLAAWMKQLEPFKGTKVVTYHKSFDYLLKRFGFELAGTLEPRPGLEPSPTHISGLIPRMKSDGVKLVVIETFRPRRTPERVANDAGAKLLVLPSSVGGVPQAKDYFGLIDHDVAQIAKALAVK